MKTLEILQKQIEEKAKEKAKAELERFIAMYKNIEYMLPNTSNEELHLIGLDSPIKFYQIFKPLHDIVLKNSTTKWEAHIISELLKSQVNPILDDKA